MNRCQNIFAFLLITAMFWNVLYVPLTYAYYYVDQSDFIARFCENIDEPEMECNGKCHLKEVTKKDATNNKAPSKMILSKSIVLFIEAEEDFDFGIPEFQTKQEIGYTNLYSYLSPFLFDRPPEVTS